MRSTRCIFSVRYTAVGQASNIRRRIGGFLRYIQQRDHSREHERVGDIEGFLRYAAHRDRTMPEGRLFNQGREVGTRERRELGRYILNSVKDLPRARDPEHDRRRACYRFVLSPEDARGLDLRSLTREAMGQLERDLGEPLPPWIAAEHRNTEHPHVHVVMAARRQRSDGRYQSVVITKHRLQRMKESLGQEMNRQRGPERRRDAVWRLLESSRGYPRSSKWERGLHRLSLRYRIEAEREAVRQLERDRGRERD